MTSHILDEYTLTFDAKNLTGKTFLLGNRGGFCLYLPLARNERNRNAQSIKWFGASGFGVSFFEDVPLWVGEQKRELNRKNQTDFEMRLDGATRTYDVDGTQYRVHWFVPDGLQAVVVTIEGDGPIVFQPEFDMRYYQALLQDFSHYEAQIEGGHLLVSNCMENVGDQHATLHLYALCGVLHSDKPPEMLPLTQRLVTKTYLKDERRDKLIHSAYKETQDKSPDNAPIWDQYSTQVYAPARFHVDGSLTFVCTFGDTVDEVEQQFRDIEHTLPALRVEKRRALTEVLERGHFETGIADIDAAYAHVLTRFNDVLVARDATLHVIPVHREHYYAIFAGNKYFMDAWKRDENISLGALLVTNDYEAARRILDDTWQFQDQRTGRLPHLIRAGEPLVYFSSDGTLWALLRLYDYTRCSGDTTLLQQKLPMVEHFFTASMNFVQRGLLPSGGIIDKTYLWETWEDTPYTPRAGYPVEIELLWLTLLDQYLPSVRTSNPDLAAQMETTLKQGRETFSAFVQDGYLADSLTYEWKADPKLTPNGYAAFSLRYPLPSDVAQSMVDLARDQLAQSPGVHSLAPRDWPDVFPAAFLDDPHLVQGKRMRSVGIYNYHRGIQWEWLNPFFVRGELLFGDVDRAYDLYVSGQVEEAIREVGLGGLSELQDMQGQVGADFQAWSMAGFVESLHLFAGVQVDASRNVITVRPSLPAKWPYIHSRARIGNTWFRLDYSHPTDVARRLQITVTDGQVTGVQVNVGLCVPKGRRVRVSLLNGKPIPAGSWTYRDEDEEKIPTTGWIGLPLETSMVLHVELGKK